MKIFPIPEIDLPKAQINTGWRKICLFRSDLPIDGIGLFVDLEVVITEPMDDFLNFVPEDDFSIIHNRVPANKKRSLVAPLVGNSSIFCFVLNHSSFELGPIPFRKISGISQFSSTSGKPDALHSCTHEILARFLGVQLQAISCIEF